MAEDIFADIRETYAPPPQEDIFADLRETSEPPMSQGGSRQRRGDGSYQSALSEGIEAAVAKHRLPSEAKDYLYAIADIESGFGRNMKGKAIGSEVSGDMTHAGDRAIGPFQFMSKTAKAYGLTDRMDPYASADAAARHLIDAYKRKGNWRDAAIGHHSGAAWKTLGKWGKDYAQKLAERVGKVNYQGSGAGGIESVPYEPGAPVPQLSQEQERPSAEEMDAAFGRLFEGFEPAVATAEGVVPDWNLTRGTGERAAELAGGAAEMTGDVGRSLEEAIPLGGITWEGWLPEYRAPAEYAEYMKTKEGDWLQGLAKTLKDADLGYVPENTWEDVKEDWGSDEVGLGEFAGTLGGAMLETFVTSTPDMVAAVANLPLYAYAHGGNLAQSRAEADGREQPSMSDSGIGLFTAAVAGYAERFGTKALGQAFKGKTAGLPTEAVKGAKAIQQIGGAILKAAGKEGVTEAIQEATEYTGVHLGTEKGFEGAQALDAALAGGILGGGPGGVAGGIGGVREVGRANRGVMLEEENQARVAETSQTVETIPETREDEAAAIRAVQDGRKQAGMVVRPESVQAAEDAGLITIEVENGTLVTTPENEEAVREAEAAGERFRVLGYAEDKVTALQDPDAVMVRPTEASGASPGAQVVSQQALEAAKELARGQAGEGGDVLVRTIEEEAADRLAAIEQEEQATEQAQAQAAAQKGQAAQMEEMFAHPRGKTVAAGSGEARQLEIDRLAKEDEARAAARENTHVAAADYADKMGVDLREVVGTGNKGKITKGDVQARIAATQEAAPVVDIEEAREKKAHAKAAKAAKAAMEPTPAEARAGAAEDLAKIKSVVKERKIGFANRKQATALMGEYPDLTEEDVRAVTKERKGRSMSAPDIVKAGEAKKKEARPAPKATPTLAPMAESLKQKKAAAQGATTIKGAMAAIDKQLHSIAQSKANEAVMGVRNVDETTGKLAPYDNPERVRDLNSLGDLGERLAGVIAKTAGLSQTARDALLTPLNDLVRDAKAMSDVVQERIETDTGRHKSTGIASTRRKIDELVDGFTKFAKKLGVEAPVVKAQARGELRKTIAASQTTMTPKQAELLGRAKKKEEAKQADEAAKAQRATAAAKATAEVAAKPVASAADVVQPRRKVDFAAMEADLRKEAEAKKTEKPTVADPATLTLKKWNRLEQASLDPTDQVKAIAERASAATRLRTAYTDDILGDIAGRLDPNDPLKTVVEAVQAKGVGDVATVVLSREDVAQHMGDPRAEGGYVVRDGQPLILLSEELVGTPQGARVFVHEVLHASMTEALRTDNALAVQMEQLRRIAVSRLGKDSHYGLTDVDEFMSEALTDAKFQRALAGVKVGKDGNLWQRLVAMVRDYLGIAVELDSVLAHVLSAAPDLMLSGAETQARRANKTAPYISSTSGQRSLAWKSSGSPAIDTVMEKLGEKRRDYRAHPTVAGVPLDKVLPLQSTSQIVRQWRARFSGAMQRWKLQDDLRNKIANEQQEGAQAILDRWQKWGRDHPKVDRAMRALMLAATRAAVDPDKDPGKDAALTAAWKSLPPDAQRTYREVRDFLTEQRKAQKEALFEKIMAFELGGKAIPLHVQQQMAGARGVQAMRSAMSPMRKPLEQEQKTLRKVAAKKRRQAQKDRLDVLGDQLQEIEAVEKAAAKVAKMADVEGPYFMQRRYGDWVITGHMKNDPDQPFTDFYESVGEAQAAMKRLSGTVTFKGGVSRKRDAAHTNAALVPSAYAQLTNKIGDPGVRNQVTAAIIDILADNAMRESNLHRKNVLGENVALNMQRGFAERTYTAAWAIGDMKTAFERNDALQKMGEQAQDNPDLGLVVEELQRRETNATGERANNKFDRVIGKFGFLGYLASISYSIVNATQTMLVGYPYLASKYGAGPAMKELSLAYATVWGTAVKSVTDYYGPSAGNWKAWRAAPPPQDIWKQMVGEVKAVDPDAAKAIEELQDRRIIDATFAQELYKLAHGEGTSWTDGMLNFARMAPQAVETFNRVTMAQAGYRLAKQAGSKTPIEDAYDAVDETQFNPTEANKPRWFKGIGGQAQTPGLRSILMFKTHVQGMYALILPSIMKSVKGDKDAQKLLGGLVISHSLAGGLAGGLLMEPVRALINTAGMLFGFDDDDVEELMGDAAEAMVGETGREAVMGGVPRLFGWDISGRVGLDDMAFRPPGGGKTNEEAVSAWIVALLGPMGSVLVNAGKGKDAWEKGEYIDAMQGISPKAVRDILETYEQQAYGVKSRSGEAFIEADEFNPWDAATQLIGVSPTEKGAGWEKRIRTLRKKYEGKDAADNIKFRFKNARPSERVRILRTEVRAHNRKYRGNSEAVIKPANLWKSLQERTRRERAIQRSGLRYYVKPEDVPYYQR